MARLQGVHGIYNPACLVTMVGAFSGCLAICLSVSGLIGFALVSLILAGLADLFDGYVARKLKLGAFEKAYGVQLDTVVDVLSFVAAPAVIGAAIAGADPLVIVCIVLYMLAGLVRLAHFNTGAVSGNAAVDAHSGLPVTYVALVLPVVLVPMELFGEATFRFALGAVFLLLALLFVAPVTVPKPRGAFYLIFPLLAVGLIGFWMSDALHLNWSIK
jgi:CDP-diacylglycerol--serine O-phosphatidyltransferase